MVVGASRYVVIGMFGVSLSYHRQLSHKSFRCHKWLEYFFAYCGALAFEGDPVEWVKNHRWHHLHSDGAADRHSPRDGIWHSHMGWLFDEALSVTRCDWVQLGARHRVIGRELERKSTCPFAIACACF